MQYSSQRQVLDYWIRKLRTEAAAIPLDPSRDPLVHVRVSPTSGRRRFKLRQRHTRAAAAAGDTVPPPPPPPLQAAAAAAALTPPSPPTQIPPTQMPMPPMQMQILILNLR